MSTKTTEALVASMPWLDDLAEAMQQALDPLLGQDAPRGPRDLLYGTWLGHPLHPALVTLPTGCWTAMMLFDLLGEERAADLSLKVGLVGAVGSALTGAAQWQDTVKQEQPRRLGALHAGLNVAATALMAGSMALRDRGDRTSGIALSTLGLGVATASSWLGGELAYDLGIGVDRTAFEHPPAEWADVAAAGDLQDGKPLRVEAGDAPIMLLRQGEEILAIGATCTHLGGPLDEGEIDGETVTCPWHRSVFSLRDGAVRHGPATMAEPAYDVRIEGERVLVRLRPATELPFGLGSLGLAAGDGGDGRADNGAS